jgi:hypothetical protein
MNLQKAMERVEEAKRGRRVPIDEESGKNRSPVTVGGLTMHLHNCQCPTCQPKLNGSDAGPN